MGLSPFPAEQISALEELCRDILSRNLIPPHASSATRISAPDP